MHICLICFAHLASLILAVCLRIAGKPTSIPVVLMPILTAATFWAAFYGLVTRVPNSAYTACYDLTL